jgi:adenylate cyclase
MPIHLQGRPISIRWSLFKNLLLLIVLISGSLLIYSIVGAARAIRHLSSSVIEETSAKTEDKLANFFEPIAKSIEIVRDLGARGLFSTNNTRGATTVLMPVLAAIPQMASINIGNERGDAFLLVKRTDEWLSISVKGGSAIADWAQLDELGRPLKTWKQKIDFEPRTRPWYELARNAPAGNIQWTAPYGFVPTGDPGITASVYVEGPEEPFVLAFDILLEDLSQFAQRINVSKRGKVFVLTDDDRLLVPPAGTGRNLDELLLKPAEDWDLPLVASSVREWHGKPAMEPFQFEYGREKWWCGFENYQIGSERTFWIGVLIPESDLLGERRRERVALMWLTVAALGVATLMSFLLSRAYSDPLRELVNYSSHLQLLETDMEVRVDSRLKEVRHLADAQENMRRALDSFGRYVPVAVVRQLLSRGEAAAIGGHEAEVTVLFTDIVGFTSIAESMSAADLTVHMSDYFDEVIGILQRHGATVDKLIGDAVMAFWGAPEPISNHARLAVEAVIEIHDWLERANNDWPAKGLPPLPTRFGLASGEVTVGNIGSHSRLSYTVLGDTVNLASRLEGLNSKLGTWVLADENVCVASGSDFAWKEVDQVKIKGKEKPVRVFKLVGRKRSKD